MDFQRRRLLCLAACAAGLPLAGIARAQAYPAKPVRVIVPFAAGGPTDVFARLIALGLSRALGQQFYVENQPGAGGNLGMGAGARAAPDGHALTVVSTSFVVNPSLYAKIPYNPTKDFAPVTLAAVSPNVLVVNPSIPATTVKELIAFLRSNPGKYSIAHPGVGTTSQLGARCSSIRRISISYQYPSTARHLPFNPFSLAIRPSHSSCLRRWCRM